MDKSMNANSIDLTDSYRMINGDNVLLMGNSNEVILPITYNSNWVSAKDSILWSYPLDSIDMVDDKLCIQEAEASLMNEIEIDADTASGVATDYCECTWSEITSSLAVEDFNEMDAAVSAGGAMPAELNAIIETCAEKVLTAL